MPLADILILSNGPGEVTTWVRPVVLQLRQEVPHARLSLVLSPCSHASGREAELARKHLRLDRIQSAEHFWRFLLAGKTAEDWDWAPFGTILFLGGDQFFAVWLARRLRYRVVVYAEWEARWRRWVDAFAVRTEAIARTAPRRWQDKFHVVGDLMADGVAGNALSVAPEAIAFPTVRSLELQTDTAPTVPDPGTATAPDLAVTAPDTDLELSLPASISLPWKWQPLQAPDRRAFQIGLLPGSKPAKLSLGVPLVLAVADCLRQALPAAQFAIPVAPTLEARDLAAYAEVSKNLDIATIYGTSALLEEGGSTMQLATPFGTVVTLWREFPAYTLLANCDICVTTVGANTAELARLGVPMVVVLPTNKLEAMRAWDGVLGLLVNLPLAGKWVAKFINWVASRVLGHLAWPNIWAKEQVVPELRGRIVPQDVADAVCEVLLDEQRYRAIRQRLQEFRASPGAARAIAVLVRQQLAQAGEPSTEAAAERSEERS
ncbi:hypothetical protein [Synechococcus sp. PCC 7336]|uniref:hypothetical protein n=1 Tax=Synechococcus sp. PCC 7336 TaxID=195250 RepID=UPI0003622D2C|nr:hypothetical protein [Synechococcus sp. PCC 7336]